MNAFFEHIGTLLNATIVSVTPLAGGDINQVESLKTQNGEFVLKRNSNNRLPGLFEKEALGLGLLKQSNSFRIPKVIDQGIFNNTAYLLLEYIPNGHPSSSFWRDFAESLAKLHRTTQSRFGLDTSNYIGSLIQPNNWCDDASEFYITQRLDPQFKMAQDRGFIFSDLNTFYKIVSQIIPKETPSLVHGDLWNGNYIISKEGNPVLIDPAVAYAPREMDLAMMQLFGGFPAEVFTQYNEDFPLTPEWKGRIPLWQLYYLLVHLNLFGVGYYREVKQIISQYS